MLRDLIRESNVPTHHCMEKYKTTVGSIEPSTPLKALKNELAAKVPGIKKKLTRVYPESTIYVGLRAVFANNSEGQLTSEIIGYQLISRRMR